MIVTTNFSKRISATATRETTVAIRYDSDHKSWNEEAELVDLDSGRVIYTASFRNVLKVAKSHLGLEVPMWRGLF